MAEPTGNDDLAMYGTGPISVSGGYLSPHLTDCTSYSFAFCELCLRKIWEQCEVKPALVDYTDGTPKSYEEDVSGWKIRLWMQDGGPEKKMPTGLCTHDEHCSEKSTHWEVCSGQLVESRRFCQKHAQETGECMNTIWLPVGDVRAVLEQDLSSVEWMILGTTLMQRSYVLNQGVRAFYRVWCEEVLRNALGLPRDYEDDWGSSYSSILVTDINDIPRVMRNGATSRQISFFRDGREYICCVSKVTKQDHVDISRMPGVENHGVRQVIRWFEEKVEEAFKNKSN